MFEKYDLNDLYLAVIQVTYGDRDWDINAGGLLIGNTGYGYYTILWKNENGQYIDLNNRRVEISNKRNQLETSYTIDYIEPLSNYYVQDEETKKVFSRRQATKEAESYYNDIHQKRLELVK